MKILIVRSQESSKSLRIQDSGIIKVSPQFNVAIVKKFKKQNEISWKRTIPCIWSFLANHFIPVDTNFWAKTFFGSQEHIFAQFFIFDQRGPIKLKF